MNPNLTVWRRILSLMPREWRRRTQHKRCSEAARRAWVTRKAKATAIKEEK
jgi:hypothetical protein